MRELIRFGEDFHETCSIRSKLVKTKLISKQLEELLVTNNQILNHEKQVLALFAKRK
jgi:hypothetical protein